MPSSFSADGAFPDRVMVVGGGRWARVLAEMLCDIAPDHVALSMHSPHNAEAVRQWAATRETTRRLSVSDHWPEQHGAGRSAAIVVNAVRDHVRATRHLIERGISALVEKPMALSVRDVEELADAAAKAKVTLAAAHIFRFASFARPFVRAVQAAGPPRAMHVWWSDPRGEERHGARKHYDASLPIYADWMPHVLSVVSWVELRLPESIDRVTVRRGGAQMSFVLHWPDLACAVELTRDGDSRQRIVAVETAAETIRFDFSREPGTLVRDGIEAPRDGDSQHDPLPSAHMLRAFLASAAGGARDERLGLDMAIAACRLSDAAARAYAPQQHEWLSARVATGDAGSDVRYAFAELLQAHGQLPADTLDAQIHRFIQSPDMIETLKAGPSVGAHE